MPPPPPAPQAGGQTHMRCLKRIYEDIVRNIIRNSQDFNYLSVIRKTVKSILNFKDKTNKTNKTECEIIQRVRYIPLDVATTTH
jgi:hypothetical protein